MVCPETDLKRNHDEYLKFVQEKVSIARKALEDVIKASDGIDGNVAFLAIGAVKDVDRIAHCASLKGKVKQLDSIAESNGDYARRAAKELFHG